MEYYERLRNLYVCMYVCMYVYFGVDIDLICSHRWQGLEYINNILSRVERAPGPCRKVNPWYDTKQH